jgi:NAD(P)-dependent dehydrogenase (short-subunit alcohol dehydrogenase family)
VLDVLRPGVLDGLRVCVAGGGVPLRARAAELGATVLALEADVDDEDAVAAAVAGLGRIDVLVVDAATPFVAAGGGMPALRTAVDGSWNAVRATVNAGWTPAEAEGEDAAGGKVVLVAPHADAGVHATAVGAALENAARTLSIEWARLGVRTTAIVPGAGARDADLAELVAFLASPGGDYFTGCVFTPGVAPAAA